MLFKNLAVVSAIVLGLMACTSEEKKMEEIVAPAQAEAVDKTKFEVDDGGKVEFKAEVVYFEYDDSTLTSEGMAQLDAIAKYMAEHADVKLSIEGHCDDRGSVEYNLALGQRRSSSVKQYLTTVGIIDTRLDTLSFGEEKPQLAGEDESSWKKNRRAEFTFVKS